MPCIVICFVYHKLRGVKMMIFREKVKSFLFNERAGMKKDAVNVFISSEALDRLRMLFFNKAGVIVNNSQTIDIAINELSTMMDKKPDTDTNFGNLYNFIHKRPPRRRGIKTELPFDEKEV